MKPKVRSNPFKTKNLIMNEPLLVQQAIYGIAYDVLQVIWDWVNQYDVWLTFNMEPRCLK